MSAVEETDQPVEPKPEAELPDLQSQLEELLDQVWSSEANWALDDRIDLALRIRPHRDPGKT